MLQDCKANSTASDVGPEALAVGGAIDGGKFPWLYSALTYVNKQSIEDFEIFRLSQEKHWPRLGLFLEERF